MAVTAIAVTVNARNELTGSERKAFAAEVGRICLKLQEMSSESDLSNLDKSWLMGIVEKTGQARSTVNSWWSSFCKATGLKLTPRQADMATRLDFFRWLDEQKAGCPLWNENRPRLK